MTDDQPVADFCCADFCFDDQQQVVARRDLLRHPAAAYDRRATLFLSSKVAQQCPQQVDRLIPD